MVVFIKKSDSFIFAHNFTGNHFRKLLYDGYPHKQFNKKDSYKNCYNCLFIVKTNRINLEMQIHALFSTFKNGLLITASNSPIFHKEINYAIKNIE